MKKYEIIVNKNTTYVSEKVYGDINKLQLRVVHYIESLGQGYIKVYRYDDAVETDDNNTLNYEMIFKVNFEDTPSTKEVRDAILQAIILG